jgi:hypothetical protein
LFRSLFWKKVPGVEGMSSNIIAPGSPKREQPALLFVPGIERSFSAPESQERTDYPMPARAIRLVMLAIDGRGGSILLTDGVYVARISKGLHVGGTALRREHSRGRAPSAERIIDDGFGNRRQDALDSTRSIRCW